MLSTEIVHSLITYHHAACRRLWDHLAALSDEQFVAEIPYSHGSVRKHMIHLAAVDRRWLLGLQGDPAARMFALDPAEYPSVGSARTAWEAVAVDLGSFVNSLTEDDLAAQPPGMPLKTWQVLLHIANHGTDHRAQVLRALHDLGAATFEQDLVYHFFAQG